MASTVLSRENHDGKFLWLMWEKPVNTPLMNSGNVNTIARVRSGVFINGDKPDATWPNYPTNDYFYSEANAIQVGKRLADWFEYQGLTRDKGHVVVDGVPYAGGIFLHNWGSPNYVGRDPQGNTGPSIFLEPEDMVSDVLTTADFAGYTNATSIVAARSTMKHTVGYLGNAVTKAFTNTVMTDSRGATHNMMGLANWAKRVMQSMKAECDARNLCYPRVLAQDLEGFRPAPYQYTGYSTKPTSTTAAPSDFPKLFRSSVLRAMQADSRYTTETVYQEWNGSAWVNKTMQDAWNAAGGPTGDPDRFFSEGNNVWFGRRWATYSAKMADYGLSKLLYEPIKEVFPGTQCGNYETVLPISASEPEFEGSNYWLKYPVSDLPVRRHMKADYQSPVLYSPNRGNQPYKYSPSRYNPNYATDEAGYLGLLPVFPGALLLLGHPFGATSDITYKNFIGHQIRSATKNNPTQIFPWFEVPGTRIGEDMVGSLRHTSSVADVLCGMTAAYETGSRISLFFNAGQNNYSQQLLDNEVQLFNQYKAYVDSKTFSPITVISDGPSGITAAVIASPYVPRVRFIGTEPLNQPLDK